MDKLSRRWREASRRQMLEARRAMATAEAASDGSGDGGEAPAAGDGGEGTTVEPCGEGVGVAEQPRCTALDAVINEAAEPAKEAAEPAKEPPSGEETADEPCGEGAEVSEGTADEPCGEGKCTAEVGVADGCTAEVGVADGCTAEVGVADECTAVAVSDARAALALLVVAVVPGALAPSV